MRKKSWASWGASVIGPSHLRLGLPNQDAWSAWHYCWGDVAVVSDGLGSCEHSQVGSRAACRAVSEAARFCQRHCRESHVDMTHLIQELWQMMITPFSPAQCSATCMFVVNVSDAEVHLGQLGDGMLAACRSDGGIDLLVEEKDDSFSNITVGLGSSYASDQWRTLTLPQADYCAFVLCTDGVSDDLLPEGLSAFAGEVQRHYRQMPGRQRSRDLRRWLRDWPVPGHTDDKTIACLYRGGEDSDGQNE